MKYRFAIAILSAALLSIPVLGQDASQPQPSPVEKELAARAKASQEITLDKNMLALAAKSEKDKATRDLIAGLDSIYIRSFVFDKPSQFTPDEAAKLRQFYETSAWSPMVSNRVAGKNVSNEILIKKVNGEIHGMLILNITPQAVQIIRMLGVIHLDELDQLGKLGALGALANANRSANSSKDESKSK